MDGRALFRVQVLSKFHSFRGLSALGRYWLHSATLKSRSIADGRRPRYLGDRLPGTDSRSTASLPCHGATRSTTVPPEIRGPARETPSAGPYHSTANGPGHRLKSIRSRAARLPTGRARMPSLAAFG